MADRLAFVGRGVYSVPEAARLTGVSRTRITRWIRGYVHGAEGARRRSPRVWTSDLPPIGAALALSFKDLMEVRFLAAFRDAGVSWKTLRETHRAASAQLHSDHPFSTARFRTDGREIFLDLTASSRERGVVEIRTRQAYFDEIVRPMFQGLEIADGELRRWWPLGTQRSVVLDPERSFGAPIVREGVATRIIASASAANSAAEIARWYEISRASVRDALEFETRRGSQRAA